MSQGCPPTVSGTSVRQYQASDLYPLLCANGTILEANSTLNESSLLGVSTDFCIAASINKLNARP